MNCQAVQNKILALPDPREVPEPLRAHVAGCGACQAWARQAARLEGLLEHLPVPPAPAGKKAALVEELSRPAEPVRPAARPFYRRNAALVGGLAAALLVAVAGWRMFGGKNDPRPEVATPGTPEHPLLKKLVQRDVAMAKADTPAKRLQALGGLADDLSAEARGLALVASPQELNDFVIWYGKAKDGLVAQADRLTNKTAFAMTPAERKAQFAALAEKLGETAAAVDRSAGQASPEAKRALQKIADAARDGQTKLTALANTGV